MLVRQMAICISLYVYHTCKGRERTYLVTYSCVKQIYMSKQYQNHANLLIFSLHRCTFTYPGHVNTATEVDKKEKKCLHACLQGACVSAYGWAGMETEELLRLKSCTLSRRVALAA